MCARVRAHVSVCVRVCLCAYVCVRVCPVICVPLVYLYFSKSIFIHGNVLNFRNIIKPYIWFLSCIVNSMHDIVKKADVHTVIYDAQIVL